MKTEIEPLIRPLVDALNATGRYRTIASCQGHRVVGYAPYVMFEASVEHASRFARLLWEGVADDSLNYYWALHGIFDNEGCLRFALRADSLENRYWWQRSKLRQDIDYLCRLTQNCCAERRRKLAPEIHQGTTNGNRRHDPSDQKINPPSASHGVFSIATRTPFGGAAHTPSALAAFDHRHVVSPPFSSARASSISGGMS